MTGTKEEKREKMQEIMKQLEDGVAAVFTSDNYIRLLDMLSKFHSYSVNNCILILTQRPDATQVASYQTWKKVGCQVRKGEKGIKVLVPIPFKYQKERTTVDENGNDITETVEAQGLNFRVGYVFDASQVDGEIPTLAKELQDNPEYLQKAVDRIVNENEDISYDTTLKQGGANGYYRVDTKQIFLRPSMSSTQTLKTIIHEKAHSLLHNSEAKEVYTREAKEVQAESVAYCVSAAFGLDTSDYSFGYVAGWSSNRELKELKSSLAVIEKTARELMQWLATATDLQMVVTA